MSTTQPQDIARQLRHLERPGSFAVRHHESAQGLAIDVDGLGEVRLPVQPARVRELIAHARPSPFGYRDLTLRDPSVRDSWEIVGDRVRLDSAWQARLGRGVSRVVEGLGFPAGARVEAKLHKLVIYEAGQFFAPHRDSEKAASNVATLVVVLPSAHEGGELVVTHHGQEVRFSAAAAASSNRLSFLGFYVDCPHEITPVASGFRVALTFTLEVARSAHRVPLLTERLRGLERRLEVYFRDNEALVYLLEHQYSRQSLGWHQLKNGDRARCDALRSAAEAVGARCYLALALTIEGYPWYGDDDDLDDLDDLDDASCELRPTDLQEGPWEQLEWPPDDEPQELATWPGGFLTVEEATPFALGADWTFEADVGLLQWFDTDGRPCEGPELSVDACAAMAVEPHRWQGQDGARYPWTGNEGGSAETWFHIAAVVVLPAEADLEPAPGPRSERRPPLRRPGGSPTRRRRGEPAGRRDYVGGHEEGRPWGIRAGATMRSDA